MSQCLSQAPIPASLTLRCLCLAVSICRLCAVVVARLQIQCTGRSDSIRGTHEHSRPIGVHEGQGDLDGESVLLRSASGGLVGGFVSTIGGHAPIDRGEIDLCVIVARGDQTERVDFIRGRVFLLLDMKHEPAKCLEEASIADTIAEEQLPGASQGDVRLM